MYSNSKKDGRLQKEPLRTLQNIWCEEPVKTDDVTSLRTMQLFDDDVLMSLKNHAQHSTISVLTSLRKAPRT